MSESDKELLELAAKAAGIEGVYSYDRFCLGNNDIGLLGFWNPLNDDGDALRLSVKLQMQVEYLEFTGNARARSRLLHNEEWVSEYCMVEMTVKDPCAATRRAIVRAAAEIGRNMK